MVGFAVTSFRENKISGLISQGIGTSMLQIPNIMRKPIIMVPQIISSAVSGLIAVIMGLRCNAAGGGMGTSGLVGIFGAIEASQGIIPAWQIALAIILCMFVIPSYSNNLDVLLSLQRSFFPLRYKGFLRSFLSSAIKIYHIQMVMSTTFFNFFHFF